MSLGIQIAIDRGGTFTDCLGSIPASGDRPERDIVIKLLSRDPNNYRDAPTEGIRRILEMASGRSIPRSEKISTQDIGTYILLFH